MQSGLGSKCSQPVLFSFFHDNFLAVSQLSVVFNIFCNAVTPVLLHKKLRRLYLDGPYWHCNIILVFEKNLCSSFVSEKLTSRICEKFSIFILF